MGQKAQSGTTQTPLKQYFGGYSAESRLPHQIKRTSLGSFFVLEISDRVSRRIRRMPQTRYLKFLAKRAEKMHAKGAKPGYGYGVLR